jgi:hypothetical protein
MFLLNRFYNNNSKKVIENDNISKPSKPDERLPSFHSINATTQNLPSWYWFNDRLYNFKYTKKRPVVDKFPFLKQYDGEIYQTLHSKKYTECLKKGCGLLAYIANTKPIKYEYMKACDGKLASDARDNVKQKTHDFVKKGSNNTASNAHVKKSTGFKYLKIGGGKLCQPRMPVNSRFFKHTTVKTYTRPDFNSYLFDNNYFTPVEVYYKCKNSYRCDLYYVI